jgi:hypothetical protein
MRRIACAALVADGSDAGLGGELVFGREALADETEFGEDLRRRSCRPSGKDMTLLLSRRSAMRCSTRLVILAISATRACRGRASVRTSSPLASGRGAGVRGRRRAIARLQ